jgi:hypothetical protein
MKWLALLAVAACDPVWHVDTTLRDPMNRRVDSATVAVACDSGHQYYPSGMIARTTRDGTVHIGGLGDRFPTGCDIYIAKPGFRTQRIRYRDLCPEGPDHCERGFDFDLVLEPD